MKPDQPAQWTVVSQVKSHRVVYFTDDPEYAPPAEGDWYYVSVHPGALPEGMTLRNCWNWRFDGAEFTHAHKEQKKPGAALLDANKAALRKLLREKIDDALRPLAPTPGISEGMRALKLAEARTVLEGGSPAQLKLLPNAAAVRGLGLREMALRIVQHEDDWQGAQCAMECLREELTAGIDQATRQDQLLSIRSRLMKEVAPATTPGYAVKPSDLTPQRAGAQPSGDELAQEQLRLQVQLRLQINALRRGCVSDYLLDDVVLRHKGRIAQAVLAAGGAVPPDLDVAALVSHAAARGMSLPDAARDVLSEMNDTARVLLETEQMKDAVLARIVAIRTFAEIEEVGKIIHALHLSPATEAPGTRA